MTTKHLATKLGYVLAVGLSTGLLLILIGSVWIGHEVKSLC